MEKPVTKKSEVFPFPKARHRIVEELAVMRILDDISEEGGIPIPPSWMRDVDAISQEILNAVRRQAEKEGVKVE